MAKLTLAGTVFHNVNADDVTFSIECEEEDIPVKGNALASGDDDVDHAYENEILRRLDRGDLWAWCCVKVTARWGDFEASDYLGCCSFEDEKDFKAYGYYETMCHEALTSLRAEIERAAEGIAPLFGAEEAS